MSRPRTHEQRLLAPATELLTRVQYETGTPPAVGLEILEAVAATRGHWRLEDYRTAFPATRHLHADVASLWADKLVDVLPAKDLIPLPLAVAALSQPAFTRNEQRQAGAYYTDFRLAHYLAAQFDRPVGAEDRIIDLAAGSGMLLAALTLRVAGGDPAAASNFVAHNVCAADLNAAALAATRVSLAAAVDDLGALEALESRLLHGDSLTRSAEDWERVAPGGFAAVAMNPPWEKLKVTRHEVLTGAGVKRHYGALYENVEHLQYDAARQQMVAYVQELASRAELQGKGEADLYKLFLELGARVLRPGGQLGLLVPAGLIRSQGTEALRAFLLRQARHLSLTVFENRASFFAIDTRFKFLAVYAVVGGRGSTDPVTLRHGDGTPSGVTVTGEVEIDRDELPQVRPDLTVPEVRDRAQWRLFKHLVTNGTSLANPEWSHTYQRELDMTNDRPMFHTSRDRDRLPLLEGRMVHQHRVMAKAYIEGTGRAALWKPLGFGQPAPRPQFWVAEADLNPALRERVMQPRAGFCDVTGQTNERTLLAALVPGGVVCGNKVPTLTFSNSPLGAERAALAWSALANSVTVDWAARRIVTTSMNYFLLRSLPLPRMTNQELVQVADAAMELRAAEVNGGSAWDVATIRARLDANVAHAFGLTVNDLALIFADFKLLDRGQPPLPQETRSTITRDLVLTTLARRSGVDPCEWAARLDRARQSGAVPYVPADYTAIVTK